MTASAQRALLGERIARHGFPDRPCRSPAEAAARTTAIQAQDNLAARLGVRSRAVPTVTDADVRAAVEESRTVVRTWLMRGTIHLVASADLRWLLRVLGPSVQRRYGTRWRQLGLTDDLLARHVAALDEMLADGPMTRPEIKAGLAERGIRLESPDPQIHTHAVVHASCLGLICRGPDRGRDATFVRLDDWLPGSPEGPRGDDAPAELARRFFAAFSPATAADFTTWSGLPSGRAVGLIRDELQPADVDGRAGYRLGEVEPARGVRLLAGFDNYLLGYRERAVMLAPEFHRRIFHGGVIRPAVLVDGRVVGQWSLDRPRQRVTLTPFEPWSKPVYRDVEAEVADVGRFLDLDLTLERGEVD